MRLSAKKILYVSDSLAANVHARGIFTFSTGILEMLRREGAEIDLLTSDVSSYALHKGVARQLGLSEEATSTPAAASFFENYEDRHQASRKPGPLLKLRKAVQVGTLAARTPFRSAKLRLQRLNPEFLAFKTEKSGFLRNIAGLALSPRVYETAKMWSRFGVRGPRIDAGAYDCVIVDTPINLRVTGNTNVVQVIHDVIPLADPTMNAPARTMFGTALAYALRRYRKFAFVSEQSRQQFSKLFPEALTDRSGVVIYPRIEVPKAVEPPQAGQKYAVMMVSEDPRKNTERAVEAAGEFDDQISLWIVGRADSKGLQRLLARTAYRRNNVRQLGYVSESEKAATIRDAVCVIVPSLAEGFGLPIVESLAQGTPVACSDIPLFREVAGIHATYFDPYSPTSMAKAVNQLAQHPPQDREALRRAALRYDIGASADSLMSLLTSP